MSKVAELEKQILAARDAYYNTDKPLMSDKAFDLLIDELKELDPDNKAITMVDAPLRPSAWQKAKHCLQLGSLDKCQLPEELSKWVSSVAPNEKLFVSDKLDGISIELVYEDGNLIQAITRGQDGIVGEDIFVNVINMQGVKKTIVNNFNGSLRGEIIMTRTVHQKYFPDSPSPRNMANGIAKRLDGSDSEHLNVKVYQVVGDVEVKTEQEQFEWLENNGFDVPNHWLFNNADEVNNHWRKYQDEERNKLDWEIDGIVVRLNDLGKAEALGSTNLRPKAARAMKFDHPSKEGIISDILIQIGTMGRATPVAIFFPKISLAGAEIERASLHNFGNIKELGVGIGAKVLVSRRNEIIPFVESVIDSPEFVFKTPTNCPECGTTLIHVGEYVQCPNTNGCLPQIIGSIQNWVKELNILELGDALIERLIKSNLVKDVSDLYLLSIENISSLERMAKKSATNVFNSIWKVNPITLDVFLGGLSIPMIGSSTIRLIMNAGYDSLEKIQKMSIEEIESVKGIGEVKAASLYQGLKSNKDIINKLLQNGVKIKMKNAEGKLSGMKICITGATNIKRATLEDMILAQGAEFKSSITKDTTHLVSAEGEQSTSSKTLKAKKQGITILSEDQLLAMME